MKNSLCNIDREAIRAHAEQVLGIVNDAKTRAAQWTDYAVDRAHGFSLFDFAVLGTCLTTFGLWLGSCFSKLFKKCWGVLLTLFAVSWLYLFWRVFFDKND